LRIWLIARIWLRFAFCCLWCKVRFASGVAALATLLCRFSRAAQKRVPLRAAEQKKIQANENLAIKRCAETPPI